MPLPSGEDRPASRARHDTNVLVQRGGNADPGYRGPMTTAQSRNLGRCSFCTREDVPLAELAVGPEANICAGCVALVTDLLEQQAKNPSALGWQQG